MDNYLNLEDVYRRGGCIRMLILLLNKKAVEEG